VSKATTSKADLIKTLHTQVKETIEKQKVTLRINIFVSKETGLIKTLHKEVKENN